MTSGAHRVECAARGSDIGAENNILPLSSIVTRTCRGTVAGRSRTAGATPMISGLGADDVKAVSMMSRSTPPPSSKPRACTS